MTPEPTNGAPAKSVDFFPLDESTIAIFAEGTETIKLTNAQMSGALRLFLRQHKLEGNWRLAENGRELQRMPDAQPAAIGRAT